MKKWLIVSFWLLFSLGVLIIIFAANSAQSSTVVNKPEILIHVKGEFTFLTEDELYLRLTRNGLLFDGQTQAELDVNKIERFIEKMSEVKSVKVYTSIGQNWNVDVTLRNPLARVFNNKGESFYIDDEGKLMKLSEAHVAKVLVFSGEIPDDANSVNVQEIINNESLKNSKKLDEIYRISNYVCNDPLLHALVGQVYIQKSGDLLIVPLVGGQIIEFGSANSGKEVAEKFSKLKIFYREAIPFEGWDKYDKISLKYNNQIVCTKKKELTKEKQN
jgi:cell division protein FtsQ